MSEYNNKRYIERKTGCWRCFTKLYSNSNQICPVCGGIICPNCKACFCNTQINRVDKHKNYELYVGKRVVYPSLYGEGVIKDCYFKDGFLRVKITFDNQKSICDLAITSALEKGIIKYIDD